VICNYKITFTNNNLISVVYRRALNFRCGPPVVVSDSQTAVQCAVPAEQCAVSFCTASPAPRLTSTHSFTGQSTCHSQFTWSVCWTYEFLHLRLPLSRPVALNCVTFVVPRPPSYLSTSSNKRALYSESTARAG